MIRYQIVAQSRSSGPSWRTLGIPDGTAVIDTLLVCADDASVAERLALTYLEGKKGRMDIAVSHVTPIEADEVVIPMSTALG